MSENKLIHMLPAKPKTEEEKFNKRLTANKADDIQIRMQLQGNVAEEMNNRC